MHFYIRAKRVNCTSKSHMHFKLWFSQSNENIKYKDNKCTRVYSDNVTCTDREDLQIGTKFYTHQ